MPTQAPTRPAADVRVDAPAVLDRIESVTLSSVTLPLPNPITDAKVLHRPAAADDRGRLPVRRDPHRGRARGRRLQLLQAGRRPGPVRARPGGRPRPDRRGPERHRAALDQAGLGRRLGRPQRRGHPGPRRASTSRCGTSRPSAPACRWPSCSAPTATRCAATTPPAASCTSRSSRSRTTPPAPLEEGIGGIKIKVGLPGLGRGPAPGARRPRAPRRRRAAHGRRQPAVGPADRACGSAGRWRSSTWSGSRSRSTPTTPRATPQLARVAGHRRSPPARC